ncbi:hypothetical protein C5167_022505 [Papaver somniferum]|uniref:Replication factor A C-terminal domain-containing protein n=1 Tax=Papaver somniferum TaxID=3469 RepID=A0A4Y7JL47_PAPSO|nr:hypothetical protein C5167_022505 [Papaver somniferum]
MAFREISPRITSQGQSNALTNGCLYSSSSPGKKKKIAGLAYQLIDDVPAFTGTSASLGKAANVIMCNATATNVLSVSEWHFLACPRCNKKGLGEQGDLWCTKCETKVDPSLGNHPKLFMLRFEVKDHTGTTIFVAPDNEIQKLVHQTEDEFITASENKDISASVKVEGTSNNVGPPLRRIALRKLFKWGMMKLMNDPPHHLKFGGFSKQWCRGISIFPGNSGNSSSVME